MSYLHIIGVWDGENGFLKVAAICWFRRQSHSWRQKGLSLSIKNQLQPDSIDNPYNPDEKKGLVSWKLWIIEWSQVIYPNGPNPSPLDHNLGTSATGSPRSAMILENTAE